MFLLLLNFVLFTTILSFDCGTTGCSNHGTCIADSTCECQPGYFWNACQVHKCFGIRNDNQFTCSGHGTCEDINTCSCDSNYYGMKCEQTSCYGVNNKDPAACSGNGFCIGYDDCECKPGWSGEKCDVLNCFGIDASDAAVCSKRGNCNAPNVCTCQEPWRGNECELRECFGLLENDPNVCTGDGLCIDHNICECQTDTMGLECQVKKCFGVWGSEPVVCSGHGKCLGYNLCDCEPGYFGVACQYKGCNGKHSILVDNFEALTGDIDTVNDVIWDQDATFAAPSSLGCGHVSESGRSLFFMGPVEERVAVSQVVHVLEGAKQRHSVSFVLMMATGSAGCDVIYMTDSVVVEALYSNGETLLIDTLEPKRYANRARKVVFEFYPERDFQIKIHQPVVYDDRKGQFSIDTFVVAVEDHLEIPCNSNGICVDGKCDCFRGEGEECQESGCPVPKFKGMSPTEGNYEGGTEVTLQGCFDEDVTKCRWYAAWRSADASSIEVPASRSNDGTELRCQVPPALRVQADRVKVDVWSDGLQQWVPFDLAYFYYFKKGSKSRRSFNSVTSQGSGVLDVSGIFWESVDMLSTDYTSIDLEMSLYFLKKPTEWQYVDLEQKSSFEVRNVVEEGVLISLEKYNTRKYEMDTKINPTYLKLYGIDVKCYFHDDEMPYTKQVPCYSYVKRTKIEMQDNEAVAFCDGWMDEYETDPTWNEDLPSCPRTIGLIKQDNQFRLEQTCNSEKNQNLRTCNHFYETAYECYVAGRAVDDPGSRVQRRCCYDVKGHIIIDECGSGRADFCAEGDLCYKYDDEGDIIGATNHYDADLLPFEVCQNRLGKCEEYESRRPSRGDFEEDWVSDVCRCTGDPHCHTWDQTYFHYYGECSYTLLDTYSEAKYLQVQGHFIGNGRPSITVALAFKHHLLHTPVIQVHCQANAPELKLDGVITDYVGGNVNIPGVSLVYNGVKELTFTFNTGEVIVASCQTWNGWWPGMNFYIKGLKAFMYYENTRGLCGLWNDQSNDNRDLVHGDDENIFSQCAASNDRCVPTSYGDSWKVEKEDTMFRWNEGELNVCDELAPPFYPEEDPEDFPWDPPEKKDWVTTKCSEFVPGEQMTQCLYDSFFMEMDEVIEYTIVDDELVKDMFKESMVLPSFEFQEEGPFDIRRNTEKLIPFELLGGKNPSTKDLVDIRVTSIELEEDLEHHLFKEDLLNKISVMIVDRSQVKVYFSDADIVGKIFDIELEVGDEIFGYESTFMRINTLCEEGFAGDLCDEPACYDVAQSSELVCSGEGVCDGVSCTCNPFAKGENCQYGFTSDSVQMVEIVLPDQTIHYWERLVVSSNIILPQDFVGDLDVYYEWSLVGERDRHEDIFLTPRYQDTIAIRPYAFQPYTEHIVKVVAKSVLGTVVSQRKVIVLPSMPDLYIEVTPVEEQGARNVFDIDCSRYLFKDKVITYSYLNTHTLKETVLMRTHDPMIRIQIPSTIEGEVTIRVRIYHDPSKKEITVDKLVTVKKSVFTEGEVHQYCEDNGLFASDDEVLDNPTLLQEIAYLLAWLNEFPEFPLDKMDDYRHLIFNALMVYSAKIDLEVVDEYLLILHGLTTNLNRFGSDRTSDNSFEVSFALILDEFLYHLRDVIDHRVEGTIHESYSNVLYQMLNVKREFTLESDVLLVLNAYDSLLDTLMNGKVNGEIIDHEASSYQHFVPFSTTQHRLLLESSPLKLTDEIDLEFPIYDEDSITEEIKIKALSFQQNPFTSSEKGKTASQTVRLRMEGKHENEFYRVTLRGKYLLTKFKYYDVSQRLWVEVGSSGDENCYIVKQTSDEIQFESKLDNAAFVMFDTTPYGLIIGFSIGVPASICIVLLVCCSVFTCLCSIAYYKSREKRVATNFVREEMEMDVDGMAKYEKLVEENDLENRVSGNAEKFEKLLGRK